MPFYRTKDQACKQCTTTSVELPNWVKRYWQGEEENKHIWKLMKKGTNSLNIHSYQPLSENRMMTATKWERRYNAKKTYPKPKKKWSLIHATWSRYVRIIHKFPHVKMVGHKEEKQPQETGKLVMLLLQVLTLCNQDQSAFWSTLSQLLPTQKRKSKWVRYRNKACYFPISIRQKQKTKERTSSNGLFLGMLQARIILRPVFNTRTHKRPENL